MKDKFIKLAATAAAYLAPLAAFAQVPDLNLSDEIPFAEQNLTLSRLLDTGNLLINVIVSAVITLSVLAIIWGGFTYVRAGGDEGKLGEAKNRIMYGVIGIGIIVVALSAFYFVAGVIQ